MIISDRLKKQLKDLEENINTITYNHSIVGIQLENFLKNFEKARYNLLEEIKKQNDTVEYEYEKIRTVDNDYTAELKNGILKIYIPTGKLSQYISLPYWNRYSSIIQER